MNITVIWTANWHYQVKKRHFTASFQENRRKFGHLHQLYLAVPAVLDATAVQNIATSISSIAEQLCFNSHKMQGKEILNFQIREIAFWQNFHHWYGVNFFFLTNFHHTPTMSTVELVLLGRSPSSYILIMEFLCMSKLSQTSPLQYNGYQ